jgi:hypothetical protein
VCDELDGLLIALYVYLDDHVLLARGVVGVAGPGCSLMPS